MKLDDLLKQHPKPWRSDDDHTLFDARGEVVDVFEDDAVAEEWANDMLRAWNAEGVTTGGEEHVGGAS